MDSQRLLVCLLVLHHLLHSSLIAFNLKCVVLHPFAGDVGGILFGQNGIVHGDVTSEVIETEIDGHEE